MKIGILTFHFAYNYGAVLQCYGLQQALKRLGYEDVEIVNAIDSRWYWFLNGIPREVSMDAIKKTWQKILHGGECAKKFDTFRDKYLNISDEILLKSISESTKKYDALIVGSDQVWNQTQHKSVVYFLNWNPSFQGKRIAYAPCCGYNIINPGDTEKLQAALNDFDALSARNFETQDFIRVLTQTEASLVPDPTVLTDYSSIMNMPNRTDKYIFVFILGSQIKGGSTQAFSAIRKFHLGKKIVAVVAAKTSPTLIEGVDEIIYDASPSEWLGLIANADLVYTNSFHCTMFAMKFHRPFVAYYSTLVAKARFEDLRTRYNIGNRIITDVNLIEDAIILPTVDCDVLLENQRMIGDRYLKIALS